MLKQEVSMGNKLTFDIRSCCYNIYINYNHNQEDIDLSIKTIEALSKEFAAKNGVEHTDRTFVVNMIDSVEIMQKLLKNRKIDETFRCGFIDTLHHITQCYVLVPRLRDEASNLSDKEFINTILWAYNSFLQKEEVAIDDFEC